jgi:hypothetical protein
MEMRGQISAKKFVIIRCTIIILFNNINSRIIKNNEKNKILVLRITTRHCIVTFYKNASIFAKTSFLMISFLIYCKYKNISSQIKRT